ncbi:MAG: AgmX/PglI C-terminal domain-containing protein [bacterium]
MKTMTAVSVPENPSLPLSVLEKGEAETGAADGAVIQFFIFHKEKYLGWDCFQQDKVAIGRRSDADLVLNDQSIADIHAIVHVKGDQLIVSDESSGRGVRVNGKPIAICMLGPFDFVTIGPYTLKAKVKSIVSRSQDLEAAEIAVAGIYEAISSLNATLETLPQEECEDRDKVKERVEGSASQPAPEVTHETAGQSAPALPDPSPSDPPDPLSTVAEALSVTAELLCTQPDPLGVPEQPEPPLPASISAPVLAPDTSLADDRFDEDKDEDEDEDEDEDDGDDSEAGFSLRQILTEAGQGSVNRAGGELLLEVIKLRQDEVIDVRLLSRGERYDLPGYYAGSDRFCLAENPAEDAENKHVESFSFFFTDQFQGRLMYEDTVKELTSLCRPENLCSYPHMERIYRSKLPLQGTLYLSDGCYEYIVRATEPGESPQVAIHRDKERRFPKNLLQSLLVHGLLLILGGVVFSLPEQSHSPVPEKPRFAQVDTRQLTEMSNTSVPQKAARPEPQKSRQPKKTQPLETQKPVPQEKTASLEVKRTAKEASTRSVAKNPSSRTGRPHVVSSLQRESSGAGPANGLSPDAGGGSGKAGGNIVNRNIKQAGLLSVLGTKDGVDPGPQSGAKQVLAAVTNLDIVSSPTSSEGNFKVGGIVGKLDTSGIEVPSGGVVTTRGSAQVLRSAGVAGKGSVAAYGRGKGGGIGLAGNAEAAGQDEPDQVGALETGQTGQKQVMAMVKAELSKKVSVQGGGMSREAVKKVIDQHLAEITNCYETALISNPSLMGKIVFEWKILLSGRVGEIRTSFSSVQSDSIHECMKEKIKSWQFPQPQGAEVVVSYPFIFDIVGF